MNELKERADPLRDSENRGPEMWAHNVDTLWTEVEILTKGTVANRLALGMRFRDLRFLYSDRNSGNHRLTSGHGFFEDEIRRRGYKPRTVRQWIEDYEASLVGRPLSSDKQKARRLNQKSSSTIDPRTAFAALLPYRAAQAAYREAAKILHPDHGGDPQKMQQLNTLWQQVKALYERQSA